MNSSVKWCMFLNNGQWYELDGAAIVAVPKDMPSETVDALAKGTSLDGYYIFEDKPFIAGNNGYSMEEYVEYVEGEEW